MRWFIYPFKCLLFGFLAMQAYFAIQIGLWTTINPDSTAFQRAERWRLCTWHWTCPIQSKWTPYDKISGNLKKAVLVSEDDIFFQHKGVRVEDMQKAWEKNQQKNRSGKQAKTALRGGSTITQQLAKNLLLSGERTLLRKGQEWVITIALETFLNKKKILTLYLNHVEWGRGVFGAEAAAQHYFQKSAAKLSAWEAARLAVMLPRPRYFEKLPQSVYLSDRAETIMARMNDVALP